jgi:hypothetical protein
MGTAEQDENEILFWWGIEPRTRFCPLTLLVAHVLYIRYR